MSDALNTVLVALVTAAASVLVAFIALRGNRSAAKVTTTTDLINQLQDERDSLVKRMEEQLVAQRTEHAEQMAEMKAEHTRQMGEMRAERDAARTERDTERTSYVADRRILLDYVEALRRQISDGNQPPPLMWPEGLNR